jgi:hypothetical protein
MHIFFRHQRLPGKDTLVEHISLPAKQEIF